MIVETLLNYATYFIQSVFSALQIITLPTDFMVVLLDIFCYGTWVIGADLMAIVMLNITAWLSFKFLGGLLLFIWRLLPLT